MKGILLAGGHGSRLGPLAVATSKQLLPVYDKPLIFYPLSTLMLAGVREVLIIAKSRDLAPIKELFGDGSSLGLSMQYASQDEPKGIAEALLIGEEFLAGSRSCLVLGDNLFHGAGLGRSLCEVSQDDAATVLAYSVNDPRPYAVVEFDAKDVAIDLEEKPLEPRSSWVVPGLYFFPQDAPVLARNLKPSRRGELEITDLNLEYLRQRRLHVRRLPRGTVWIDAGTPSSLLAASQYVQTIADRQGLIVSCPEEIALNSGWISTQDLEARSLVFSGSDYGIYLRSLLTGSRDLH